MKKPLHIVLDTSIFVNPDSRFVFGNTPRNALENFLDQLGGKKHLSCHIPPSVYAELMKFIENPLPAKKTILIDKRPPSSYQTSIPALFVYELIEEIRMRINKGLRIAEKYNRKELNTDKRDEKEIIKILRHEYRTALREGMIDSKEDFDLILLAKELNAYLSTSDNGLIKWAQKLGIACLTSQELKEILIKD